MKILTEESKVLILSHFFINPILNAASSTTIRNYLLNKVRKVVQMEQPFPASKDKFAYILVYENGVKKRQGKFKAIKKPDWFAYLVHPLFNFFLVLRSFSIYDLCIACDNLSFISVLLLRRLGLIKRIVYYSIDYVEERFQNKLINGVYHAVDRIACRNSDENWVVAKEQIVGRKENGLVIGDCATFRVVPIAFRNKEIRVKSINQIDYYNLAFVGGLRESTGIQLAISALPQLLRKFPKIKLTVIGGGEYRKYLEKLVRQLGVSKNVEFLGMIISHKRLIKILTRCSIGLAPYAPVANSISYRSDPGKIKLYLACGLPVITTKIATSSRVIAANMAGLVVHPGKDDVVEGISYLLSNRKRYRAYRKRALLLTKRYDADKVLGRALGGNFKIGTC